MKYRKLGKPGTEVSVLGFGAMRMPIIGGDTSRVDEAEAARMIHHAIDQGVNYIDTAYVYHGEQSETVVGKILRGGYRERVKLATKLPSWLVEGPHDFDRFLDKQLERLQTGPIDFYLLHALNATYWSRLRDWGILEWAEGAIADGRIRSLGFSFHDEFEVFKEIVDAYDKWALCQIQYNFMDIEYQAGTKGLRYAAQKGLPVVVMEPLRGGRLAHKIPKKVAELWQGAGVNRTPADWALQWVWNHPEVSILLSGMSTMQHVKENLASADHSAVGLLTKKDLVHFDKIREEYRRLVPISCTDCRYCLPCPNSVEIADIFEYYNDAIMYDNLRSPRYLYDNLGKEKQACNCVECLECEEKCPQGIPIVEQLKKAHTLLGKQAP